MFGILIGDIRRKSGIRAEELAQGLCTLGMLKSYETGNREPEKLLADALFQRMGKSVDKYDVMLDADEYRLAVERAKIPEYLTKNRLKEAEGAMEAYRQKKGADKPLHLQYLSLMRAELLRKKNAPLEEQKENIQNGLSQTIEKEKLTNLTPNILLQQRFSLMELFLLQRYAVIQGESGNEYEAFDWHHRILLYMEPQKRGNKCIEHDWVDVWKVYPFSAFWLAKMYDEKGRYNEALEYIEKSREMLAVSANQSALFAHMMELRFDILEHMGKPVSTWERNCLALMYEAIGTQRGLWWDDWYPVYIELHIHSVNKVIAQRRKAHGWTEEELAFGICDARTVKRLETECHVPQKKISDALLRKLGISVEKYDGGIVTKDYSDYKESGDFKLCCNRNDYDAAQKIFDDLTGRLNENYVTNHQFEMFWGGLLQLKTKKISKEDYEVLLWNLLQETLPIQAVYSTMDYDLMKYEREIVTRMGWRPSQFRKSDIVKIIHGQYQRMRTEEESALFFRVFESAVVHCYAILLLEQKKYDEASKFLQEEMQLILLRHRDEQLNRLCIDRFNIQRYAMEDGLEDSECHNYFHWLQIAYAYSKLYMRDEYAVCFIENYVNKNYPNHKWVLVSMQ